MGVLCFGVIFYNSTVENLMNEDDEHVLILHHIETEDDIDIENDGENKNEDMIALENIYGQMDINLWVIHRFIAIFIRIILKINSYVLDNGVGEQLYQIEDSSSEEESE